MLIVQAAEWLEATWFSTAIRESIWVYPIVESIHVSPVLKVTLDAFNVLNASHHDIDYYFTSRLPGEPLAGVADHHVHPVVPRTLRLAATVVF